MHCWDERADIAQVEHSFWVKDDMVSSTRKIISEIFKLTGHGCYVKIHKIYD